jgi:hypothetical protein
MGKTRLIEDTIGTGLPTLLAKNLKLVNFELPERAQRAKTDAESIPKLRELFGKGRIMVTARDDGSFVIKVPGGAIVLTN